MARSVGGKPSTVRISWLFSTPLSPTTEIVSASGIGDRSRGRGENAVGWTDIRLLLELLRCLKLWKKEFGVVV